MQRLTEQDLNNLIAFLDRVECRGIKEAEALIILVQKLSQTGGENESEAVR